MYKLLLCWRYLRTRYLALACIISVMLGVATLIVVNSVMSGFSTKLKERLHGLLSDIVIESWDHEGFADPDEKISRIQASPIGDKIAAMAPTIEILGLVQFEYRGRPVPPRGVHLVGIDPQRRAAVGGFTEFLVDRRNRENPTFELSPEARRRFEQLRAHVPEAPFRIEAPAKGEMPPPDVPPPPPSKTPGVYLGWAIGHYRKPGAKADDPEKDVEVLQPGDEIILHTISGVRLSAVYESVAVADFIKTEMSEYDSQFVFVPLDWLQKLRTMENRASHIQIRLKNYSRDKEEVVAALSQMFPHELSYNVQTWEEKQGALLAAISIEKGILNVLLFLIIGVAGFGILSIFAMIVVEKTRDIGILKALGASNIGVMKIFLGYGLLLGAVGAGLGTILGLIFTENINAIEQLLTRISGHEIFDRTVYYFDSIPTDIQTASVVIVNCGAVAIAVIFSIIPAFRAAMLRPVQALRYE